MMPKSKRLSTARTASTTNGHSVGLRHVLLVPLIVAVVGCAIVPAADAADHVLELRKLRIRIAGRGRNGHFN
jgi:hypothetical protein